jgi:hypothetical protein
MQYYNFCSENVYRKSICPKDAKDGNYCRSALFRKGKNSGALACPTSFVLKFGV